MIVLKLIKILKPFTAGITIPHLVSLSNNQHYVIKFPGNPETSVALFNEYVSIQLANKLNLPTLSYEIVECNFNDVSGIDNLDTSIRKENGKSFATSLNNQANIVQNHKFLLLANNSNDFLKIFIFDILIGNYDRNKGNLLYDNKLKKIIMIDHTHVFFTGTLIRSIDLNRNKDLSFELHEDYIHPHSLNLYFSLKNGKYFKTKDQIDEIENFVFLVKSLLKDDLISIINNAHEIWPIEIGIKDSLAEFLYTRLNRIDEVINLLEIEVK